MTEGYPSVLTIALLGIGSMQGSLVLSFLLMRWARRRGVVDRPDSAPDRKVHTTPVPLVGGLAVFLTVTIVLGIYAAVSDRFLGGYLLPKHLIGMTIAGLLLMIGGTLDDRRRLPPLRQIIWPVLATLVIVASGIGISYISNPLGDAIMLNQWSATLLTFHGTPYHIVLLADAFTFLWMMGMMYTTKFLDGLDGLVSGVTVIGSCILFLLSLRSDVAQPETALIAVILGGAFLGFTIINFHPARAFLGEGGSLYAGFMLGVLSIISGGKIATALLIMGIPILDVVWVVIRRVVIDRVSMANADRKHLHYRLLDAGFSHRGAVFVLYALTAFFGITALIAQGKSKVIALVVLVAAMLLLAGGIILKTRSRRIDTGASDGYTGGRI